MMTKYQSARNFIDTGMIAFTIFPIMISRTQLQDGELS